MLARKLIILVLLLLLCACKSTTWDGIPPAGIIPEYIPPAGASESLLINTGRTLHDHVLVAENENFSMYLYEPRLSLIIQDRKSGAYMRSSPPEPLSQDNNLWQGLYMSGVTLDYIEGFNNFFSRACLMHTEHKMEIFYSANGFSAKIFFPEIEIGYTVIVTLTENGFTAEIPQSSIMENNPLITVGAFYLFPFLGYSYRGQDEGYMFIPDGQGALIKLQDNERRFNIPFSESVFGWNPGLETSTAPTSFQGFNFTVQPELILMPVYGMLHTDKQIGFLGVIESGYENATIEAFPNGVSTDFDWISARFIYSHVFQQPMGMQSGFVPSRTPRPNRIDAKMRFIFVVREDATYAGLAVAYRNFLTDSGAFKNAKMDDFRIGIDFLGVEQRDWALFRLNVNMTTFEQAEDIIRSLYDSGVNRVFTRYSGWTRRGSVVSLPTRSYNPAGSLGGSSGLISLQNTVHELGGELVLEVNPLDIYVNANAFESLNAMRLVTGRTAEFSGGNMRITSPPRTLEISRNLAHELGRRDFLVDIASVPSLLTSFSHGGTFFCRSDSAELFRQSVIAFDESPALSSPFAYLWGYSRALTHMPSTDSGYLFTYKSIPFLSIATSGKIPVYLDYVNFQANQRRFFLNLVETGVRPMFLITAEDSADLRFTYRNEVYSSMFDMYEEQIIQWNNELSELHKLVGDASIIHYNVDGNTVMVGWSNGLWVYINYGRVATNINGVEVNAMSYTTRSPL